MFTELATDIMTNEFEGLGEDVRVSQRQKGIRDTGRSAASIRVVSVGSGESFRVQLRGMSRLRFQNEGRGPNRSGKPSRDMVQALREWAVRHGMDEAAGYPIALKIAREGIRVPNRFNPGRVLDDPLDPRAVRDRIVPRMKQGFLTEIRSELLPAVRL